MKRGEAQIAQGLFGMLLLAAAILGISGTIYKLLEPGGWLTSLARQGVPGGLVTFSVVLVVGALAWVAPERQQPWRRNALVYGFAGAGVYYVAMLVARGMI